MTQLALTSKKIFFFFTLHAKNASLLRLCLKSTLEILQIDPRARGFKKGPRRPTTSVFLSLSPPGSSALSSPFPLWPRLLERRRKVSGTHGVRVSSLSRFVLVYYITHTQVLPHPSFQEGRAEYKCKKETMGQGGGGARRYIGGGRERREVAMEGEGEEVWKKKQRSSTNYNYVA